MFFSLPALLLGTALGAVLAEKWFANKSDHAALKAGAGAALGFLASSVAKLGCACAMIALYALAVVSSASTGAAGGS